MSDVGEQSYTQYQSKRLDPLMTYYDRGATLNKRLHNLTSLYIIIVSGSLAVILELMPVSFHPYASCLAASIAIVVALKSHYKFHETWIKYRSTWDELSHENTMFNMKAGHYKANDDLSYFVERVESIVAGESKAFRETFAPAEQERAPFVRQPK